MQRSSFIARQASRPAGWVGRLLLRVMARETSKLNRQVLDALAPADGERVLEIGFGHGRTIVDAARLAPTARFAGIDISPDAKRVAARRCRDLIEAGRVELRSGDAATLPWDTESFDAAYSVHTIYFWPEPATQLAEARRILRRGGRLVLGLRERSDEAIARFPASTYRFYSNDEVAGLLAAAGFAAIETRHATSGGDLRIVTALALGMRTASPA